MFDKKESSCFQEQVLFNAKVGSLIAFQRGYHDVCGVDKPF
ncbi:hypothetical protein ABEY41_19935 [Peribacillus butanolivorans]